MTPHERAEIVAGRIADAREFAGLTLGQAAKLLGMDRDDLDAMERFLADVTVERLAGFARAYDVNFAWLAGEGPDQLDPATLPPTFREGMRGMSAADRGKMLKSLAMTYGPGGPADGRTP